MTDEEFQESFQYMGYSPLTSGAAAIKAFLDLAPQRPDRSDEMIQKAEWAYDFIWSEYRRGLELSRESQERLAQPRTSDKKWYQR